MNCEKKMKYDCFAHQLNFKLQLMSLLAESLDLYLLEYSTSSMEIYQVFCEEEDKEGNISQEVTSLLS
jgi:hypothetical protein